MQSTVLVWLPIALGLFCDLPLGNKLGSQVGKENHKRTDDSISIIVIDTCFSLIKSLHNLKIQMGFYHSKIMNLYLCYRVNKCRFIVDRKHDNHYTS